jgi:hypothetical protein
MPQGDIYRLTAFWQLAGQVCQNVLHFGDDGTGGSEANLISSFDNYFTNSLRTVLSNELTALKIRVAQIYPLQKDPVEANFTSTGGTIGAEALPGTVALVWTLRTGTASRRRRGRVYWAGVTETYHLQGKLTVAGEASWQAVKNTFDGLYLGLTGGTSSWYLVVWSRVLAGAPPYNANAASPVNSTQIQTVLATQRRRRIGVGS